VGVEVEFLIGANLALKEIQSDESESAPVVFAVFPDVDPLHEAHVGLEGKWLSEPGPLPRASDPAIADEAVEVGDLRRLVALVHGPGRDVVDENAGRGPG
jgi:hypothetical protein